MNKLLLIAFSFLLALPTSSVQSQTIFSFGKHPVDKAEFLRIYEKNNANKKTDYSNASVREYLELYALFRMKVEEAHELKLDTSAAFKRELDGYKSQLAKSYLLDKEVTRKLTEEAYDRLKEERRIAHILIAVRPSEDSTRAKALADSLYGVLQEGKEHFSTLAAKYSDDVSTARSGGQIGYVTALQVVYPFETVAYQTPAGKVSKPFRTQFGYHLLKVEGIRPNRGQVQVAQIMIATPSSKGEKGIEDARKKVAEVQKELKAGKSFEELVAQYSDDRFSNQNKGLLEPFSVGKMTPAFEETAFHLQKPGDISEPIQTEFGFHILKLIKKEPLQPLSEIYADLSRRVENDSRSTAAKDAYTAQVKTKMKFREYPDNLNEFLTAFTHDTARTIDRDRYKTYKKPLFELKGKTYKQDDFLNYVFSLTNGNLFGNKVKSLTDLYHVYQGNMIQEAQQEELMKTNAEFRELVHEYENGILLFDLMDRKVWSKASIDTAGLEAFYDQHKNRYVWLPGFEGTVFTSTNENEIRELKKYIDGGMTPTDALEKIGEGKTSIATSSQSGRYEFSQFPLSPEDFSAGETTKIYSNDNHSYGLIYAINVDRNQKLKSFSEARGFVVADYQDYLEKEWNRELKAKYPLTINEKVLNSIVK